MNVTHSRKLLQDLSFVVIDLETTGANCQKDQIIEIGMVKIENLKVIDEFHQLIKPKVHIPPFVQKLTSLSPKKLANAPSIETTIDDILLFIGDSIVVAHNISFDFPFLNSVLRRLKKPELKNHSLCTHIMSQNLLPTALSSNLKYVSHLFGIPLKKAHQAIEDARACGQILLLFLDVFIERGIQKVKELYFPGKNFELHSLSLPLKEKEKTLKQLSSVQSTALLKLKGENGEYHACLPLKNPSQEQEIILSLLKTIPCHTLSIQIVSSFFEALRGYNTSQGKIPSQTNNLILSYLEGRHLEKKSSKFPDKEYRQGIDPKHFLVTYDIIPDQLCIYPLFNLQKNSSLTFRLPDHKNLFLNYASRHLYYSQKNNQDHSIKKKLFPFIQQYLTEKEKEKNQHYLFLPKDLVKQDKEKFYKLTKKFLKDIPEKTSFPKKHL